MPDDPKESRDGNEHPGEAGARSLPLVLIAGLVTLIAGIAIASTGDLSVAVARVAAPALVALLIGVAALGTGAAAIAMFGRLLSQTEPEEGLPVLLIVGYPLLGSVEMIVGLVSADVVWLMVPVVAFAAFGIRVIVRRQPGCGRRPDAVLPASSHGPKAFAAIVLYAVFVTAAVMALLPAVSLDEVSYHLAIPKIWIAEGRAVSLPLMSHSFFPLGTEAADLPAIALLGSSGAVASHLLHLMVAFSGALVMIRALPRMGLSLLGVAAIASTPAIVLHAGWSGADLPLVAVSVVLFLFLDRFVRRGEGLAGVAAAVAAGLLIKYTFLPVAGVLLGSALLFATSRRRALAGAVAAGLVPGSLFFLRNLILTSNPIEPFLSGSGGEIARFRWSGSWSETATAYMFDTRLIDDSLGFVLPGLALAGLALVRTIDGGWRRTVVVAMIVVAVILTLVGPSGRILLPFLVIPAWIVLAALVENKERVAALIIGTLLFVATLVQLGVSWLHLDRLDPLRVVSGSVEQGDWVASHRQTQTLIEEGNRFLTPDRKTLVVGINELFWFDGRVNGGANFDSERVSAYVTGQPAEVAGRWRRDGVESVLLYPGLIRVGQPQGRAIERQRALILTPAAAANLRETLRIYGVMEGNGPESVFYRIEYASNGSR